MASSPRIVHIGGVHEEDHPNHPPRGSEDYYFLTWGSLIARRIAERYPSLEVETWGTDREWREPTAIRKHGVTAMLFPTRRPRPNPFLTQAMVDRLRQYAAESGLIVHLHCLHNPVVAYLSWALPQAKIIAQHHGDFPPRCTSARGLARSVIERLSFHRLSAATYLTARERDYLRRLIPEKKLHFLVAGADYEFFQPLSKEECRRALGLDLSRKYGLYVGKFYRLKAVDRMIEACRALAGRHDFQMVFVGGEDNAENDLFDAVVSSGCPNFRTQPWSRMPLFFGACDFLAHLGFRYNGFDTVCLESLAANRPVLTSYFNWLPYDWRDWGLPVRSEDDFTAACERMIGRFGSFEHCRETSARFASKQAIVDRIVGEIYGLPVQGA